MAKDAKRPQPVESDKHADTKAPRKPKEFDATIKDLASDSPVDFLTAFDAPPGAPVEVLARTAEKALSDSHA